MANDHVDDRTACEIETAFEDAIREYSGFSSSDVFISNKWNRTSKQDKAVLIHKGNNWRPIEFDLSPILLAHRNGGLNELVGLLVAEMLLVGDE